MTPEQMGYLLRWDSTYGPLKEDVVVEEGEVKDTDVKDEKGSTGIPKFGIHSSKTTQCGSFLCIGASNNVKLSHEKKFRDIPWAESGVQYVIECSGQCLTMEKAKEHLHKGVEKVILSAPPKDESIPMFVMGCNQRDYVCGTPVLSNASCTTNAVAPLVKILNDKFGIKEALMTTVHAATASQKVIDGVSGKDNRAGRSVIDNIIPATTGAADACAKVVPGLEGKLTGLALRVPVSDVSIVDLTFRTETPTTVKAILATFEEAASRGQEMEDLILICNEKTVSTDWKGCLQSCIVDAPSCIMLNEHFFKVLAWYDNEMGYAARLVDMVCYVHRSDAAERAAKRG
jgi:glyceraldehyde 3-phosphate dehydrogenase